MNITAQEQAQLARIREKLPRLSAKDPQCAVFGAVKWRYRWPEPATEAELAAFETEHQIELPREYRLYLKYIANGGPGFAYGLYPLAKTERPSDIRRASPHDPEMTQEEFDQLWEQQEVLYEQDPDSDEDLFYNGLLTIATEGCTYDICLVVTGKFRGRLIQTDLNKDEPFHFIYDLNFLNWYERWLDDFLAGLEMSGFGGSIPGNQAELRARYADVAALPTAPTAPQVSCLRSLARFAQAEPQTIDLWEQVAKTETARDVYESAVFQLVAKAPARAAAVLKDYGASADPQKREVLVRSLHHAVHKGVDLKPYLPDLPVPWPTPWRDRKQ